MKKVLFLLSAMVLVLGVMGSAGATHFDLGLGSYVDTSDSNGLLNLWSNVNSGLDSMTFDLAPGEEYTFYFATLGTDIDLIWSDLDDPVLTTASNIYAHINFDTPALTPVIHGYAGGFEEGQVILGVFVPLNAGWFGMWMDPVLVSFGDGGQFGVWFEGNPYWGWYSGEPAGQYDLYATVHLLSEPNEPNGSSVPDASIMLLLGSSLLGLGVFSRKSKRS